MRPLGADDESDHAALTAERTPVECPLQEVAVESQHGRAQADMLGKAEVNGVNRLVCQSVYRFRNLRERRDSDQERIDAMRGQGADHVGECVPAAPGFYQVTAFTCVDSGDSLAGEDVPPACLHVTGRGLGKQGGEVNTRQQEIARRAFRIEAIAQHVQKHLRRGRLGRGVECGDAQRAPQQVARMVLLSLLVEKLGDAHVGRQPVIAASHAQHESHCAQALAQRQAA